jgi:hypothetical protein
MLINQGLDVLVFGFQGLNGIFKGAHFELH